MRLLVAGLLLSVPALAVPADACWDARQTFSVVRACASAFEDATLEQCLCFADELRRVSPDPDSEATTEEIAAAVKACRIAIPKPKPPPIVEGQVEL